MAPTFQNSLAACWKHPQAPLMLFKFLQQNQGSKVSFPIWVFSSVIITNTEGKKTEQHKAWAKVQEKDKNIHLGGKTKMVTLSPLCPQQSSPALGVSTSPQHTGWILCKMAPASNVTLTFNLSLHFSTTLCAQNWRTSHHYNGPRPAWDNDKLPLLRQQRLTVQPPFIADFFWEIIPVFPQGNH